MVRFLRTLAVLSALVMLMTSAVLVVGSASVAQAQESQEQADTTTSGPDYDLAQMAEYKQAILTCDTPSLECLVHYTSRYIAIEWLTQTVGGAGGATAEPKRSGGSDQLKLNDAGEVLPQKQIVSRDRGVIGSVNGIITQMFTNQPAATSTFVADVIHSAGFAQPAYAQGLGFASLSPVLDLWKVFRNIAYTFFALVFIVIGFMIMFRTKISGNAAVTAQQAIPSIIMSLVFVTFSYAIAGFMIDMMYIVMYLILGIFGTSLNNAAGMDIINFNILQLAKNLFTVTGFSEGAFQNNLNVIDVFLDSFTNNPVLNNDAVAYIGSILLSLVFAIAALIATVKLFFELLKSYASIIISVVLSPVILMVGAMPGKNAFTPWVKNLAGNLIAFPTVLMVLVIFYQFVGATGQQRFESGGFMPPFLLGRGQADIIATLMGFALLLALPDIVKKAKEALGAKGGFGEMVVGAGFANAKQAWSGKHGVPGVKLAAQLPTLVTGKYQIGKESQLENMFWGSRSARRREDEIRRLGGQHATPGFYGVVKNKWDKRKGAQAAGSTATQNQTQVGTTAQAAQAAPPSAQPATPPPTNQPNQPPQPPNVLAP
jgi:hypothetical protein